MNRFVPFRSRAGDGVGDPGSSTEKCRLPAPQAVARELGTNLPTKASLNNLRSTNLVIPAPDHTSLVATMRVIKLFAREIDSLTVDDLDSDGAM